MENGTTFYRNTACAYFPCHAGVDEQEFNCLFCYCPLYALGPRCGGDFSYTNRGIKDCSACTRLHQGDQGVRIVRERFTDLAELARLDHDDPHPTPHNGGPMRALVVGGSGSGKSVFAERITCALADKRVYVATMLPHGREAKERIARHRAQRAGLGFRTLECTPGLPQPVPDAGQAVVLIDDLGNLCANTLFVPDGTMVDPANTLRHLIDAVDQHTCAYAHAVVVGNLVGSEGPSLYEGTQTWIELVGSLCCELAARFDTVVEVTCGIPTVLKGSLPTLAARPTTPTAPAASAAPTGQNPPTAATAGGDRL